MGWISDLIINVSAFRIKIGEKLNKLWLDIGNKANLTTTNKNSLVEAVNEVNAKSSNFKVGGRNYQVNGRISSVNGYNGWNNITSLVIENTTELRIIGQNAGYMYFPPLSIPIPKDQIVTVSFKVKNNTGTPNTISTTFNGNGGPQNYLINPNAPWTTVSRTGRISDYTASNTLNILLLENYNSGHFDISIKEITVTIGNMVLDWTPAPEDQIPDWNQNDATQFNYIKNKPDLTHYDFRKYGLGVNSTELWNSSNAAKGGFYGYNDDAYLLPDMPFKYGKVISSGNDFQILSHDWSGDFYIRHTNYSTYLRTLYRIWTDKNFNPDSKVNVSENAVAVGFSNGSFAGLPYFFHATGGYKFVATIEYLNAQNYASVNYVNQQIAEFQSPYKYESNNIKTVGNGWQTYVGGRYNQALGDKITVKGNNLNYIGFNHVGSGALHAVLGNYNVSNGVLNNIVGNYSSANSNLINLIGNYLYSKQEGQSVYGNYNKITVPSNIPSKKVIHAFASGKSEYERDNAVEIFADNSTKARGRMYYDEQTRDEQWFENGTTLIDVNYLNSRINGNLQTDANSYDVCANNVLVVGVRKNTQTATDSEFQRINNENCFGVYGIAKGRYDVDADTSIMYYKDSFYIGASATAALASVVDKKPYLVVILDPKTMQFDSIQYLDIVTIMQNKQIGLVQIVLGSFVNHNSDIYLEFHQQIIM